MTQVVVVGAGGQQGFATVETLARALPSDELLAVDRRFGTAAREALDRLGVTTCELDPAADRDEALQACAGANVIANLAGPFHEIGASMLDFALELGVDYLDVCDDGSAIELLLGRHETVRDRGLRAVVGMGSAPGMTNVLVRLATDHLEASSERPARVDLRWLADSADITPGILHHVLACMDEAAPDGTPAWEGLAPEVVPFDAPVGEQLVVAMGHPESVTLPRYLPIAEMTNKGASAPAEYTHFLWTLARAMRAGVEAPELERAYAGFEETVRPVTPRVGSAFQIDVAVDGRGLRFSAASEMETTEATAVPAAAGVLVLLDDAFTEPGAWPAERLAPRTVFERLGRVSRGRGGLAVHALEDGEVRERMSLRKLIEAA